ncbi:MAG: hypothetical protein HZA17_05195 [Nitrospirae bacterium]|nr:hypothetical protein [Nitrospirota bacterium]
MAHEVNVKFHATVVAHRDIEIEIKTNMGKLGTLLISKGNVEWLPKSKSVNKKRLSWPKFAELMESEGRSTRKK